MRLINTTVLSLLCLIVTSCTEPGETTGMAASAGGVMGAGVGAIIGSQTGNAGAGLTIGAIAGSGTGALIGNSLEAQEKSIRTQDEALERQQQVIAAQRRELEELRGGRSVSDRNSREDLGVNNSSERMDQTRSTGWGSEQKDSTRNDIARNETARNEMVRLDAVHNRSVESHSSKRLEQAYARAKPLREVDLTPASSRGRSIKDIGESSLLENSHADSDDSAYSEKRAAVKREFLSASAGEANVKLSTVTKESLSLRENSPGIAFEGSSECKEANIEIQRGNAANESADKLFHLRRALRLCPTEASFHNQLGELYLSLNRKSDAVYEFKEALNLNPAYVPAEKNLALLNQ